LGLRGNLCNVGLQGRFALEQANLVISRGDSAVDLQTDHGLGLRRLSASGLASERDAALIVLLFATHAKATTLLSLPITTAIGITTDPE
jgi:hypothetical protein